MTLSVVELFAGGGGAACGLGLAGLVHLLCVEINPDACATLTAAGLPVLCADVRRVALPRAAVLWASFPCPNWSRQGTRGGARDDRNGWPWTLRAIDAGAFGWVVLENVADLAAHRSDCDGRATRRCAGCYFERAILARLRERFAVVSWRVLDAVDYGTPQHRQRLFVVAGPRAIAWPRATHGRPDRRRPVGVAPWVSLGAAIGAPDPGDAWNREKPPFWYRATHPARPSRTLSAAGNGAIITPGGGSRRLTVAEYATVQGFPPSWEFCGQVTSRYAQIGNAVPPILARKLGESLTAAEREFRNAGDARGCRCGCGRVLPEKATGRPARYARPACRQRAYRKRAAGQI